MSFDVPVTPVEIVKVGHPALRNGTRSVPQELFGTENVADAVLSLDKPWYAWIGFQFVAPLTWTSPLRSKISS